MLRWLIKSDGSRVLQEQVPGLYGGLRWDEIPTINEPAPAPAPAVREWYLWRDDKGNWNCSEATGDLGIIIRYSGKPPAYDKLIRVREIPRSGEVLESPEAK